MPPASGLTKAQISKKWQGYKETKTQLHKMHDAGWLIVAQSKHGRPYCPCDPPRNTRISGSPQNDPTHARRLASVMSKCPDQHDLIH